MPKPVATSSSFHVLIPRSKPIELRCKSLNLKIPPNVKQRFAFDESDLLYDRVPLWMKDKKGFVIDWQGRDDARILTHVETLGKESKLFEEMAKEMRISCSRHLEKVVRPAVTKTLLVEKTLSSTKADCLKNDREKKRLMEEISNLRGCLQSHADEKVAKTFLRTLRDSFPFKKVPK